MTVIELGGRRARQGASTAEQRPGRGPGRRGQLLYEQVIELVDRIVVEQHLQPGDLLPTQAELAERAGVSLITVRRALDELERDGRLRRHQGLGTFVARPKIVSQPTIAGGLGNTLQAPDDRSRIATTLLGLERVLASPELADALRRDPREQLWQVRRHRLIGGRPMMLETALIPVALAPDLDAHREELYGSLYDLLARTYGLVDDYEEQYLEVVSPGVEDRRQLKLTSRAQVVRIRGLSVDTSGTPFDCFEQVYPAGDFVFGMSGSTSRRLLQESTSRTWSVRPIPGGGSDSPGNRPG